MNAPPRLSSTLLKRQKNDAADAEANLTRVMNIIGVQPLLAEMRA